VDDQRWWQRSPEQREADLERLREAVSQAQAVVTSERHEVTVTLGPGGALTGIDVSRAAVRLDGRALGEVIRETLAKAAAEAQRTMAERVGELTGGQGYLGALAGRLPDPPEPAPVAGDDGTLEDDDADEDDDTTRRLRALAAESQELLREYAAARTELSTERVTARSLDRTVQVTVTTSGTVEQILIDDAALRQGLSVLGGRVCAVVQEARARAALATADRIQRIAGTRLNVRELVEQAIPAELRPDDGKR
jgi:DNA-binding protein YbaB